MGSVLFSVLEVRVIAIWNSFHAPKNASTPQVAMAGFAKGKMTRQKV